MKIDEFVLKQIEKKRRKNTISEARLYKQDLSQPTDVTTLSKQSHVYARRFKLLGSLGHPV